MVGVAIVEGGRFTRLEVFEVEDAEQALARFAELCRAGAAIMTCSACRHEDRVAAKFCEEESDGSVAAR